MINHRPPPNWVAEIADFDLELTFIALHQIVKRDVEEANKLPPHRRKGSRFVLEANNEVPHPFIVVQEVGNAHDDDLRVTFKRLSSSIGIWGTRMKPFAARPRFNGEKCVLSVDGKDYRLWELSQMALNRMFFAS